MLKIDNICKRFGGIHAVRNCCLHVARNEIVGIIGANGAGKSTLLNLITGISIPDKGKIFFKDREITSYEPYRRYRMGLNRTFQSTKLFRNFDVKTNLELGNQKRHSYKNLLKQFKLYENLDNTPNQLSIGQQHILEIIRALSDKCHLTVLDEPFSGVHKRFINNLIMTVKEMKKQRSFLIVDHNLDTIFFLCDRIVVMDKGKIIDHIKPNKEYGQRIKEEICKV